MAQSIHDRHGRRPGPWQAAPDGIFLSYRRGDSRSTTARLTDDLVDYFGRRRVYRDVDSNRAGQDFLTQIDEALIAARAMVAVIGPSWVSITDPDGARRLDDPADVVRAEITRALEAEVPILPVLVGGASMPKPGDVPKPLRAVCTIHALRLSDDDWRYDLGRLLEALEHHGVVPVAEEAEPQSGSGAQELLRPRRFERSLKASRIRAYGGVVRAVEALRYSILSEDADAASITFRLWGKERQGQTTENPRDLKMQQRFAATAKVLDAGPGQATVLVELRTIKTGYLATGAAALAAFSSGLGIAAWPALRMWEKRFARGILDNVEGVLEGRGIGPTHRFRRASKRGATEMSAYSRRAHTQPTSNLSGGSMGGERGPPPRRPRGARCRGWTTDCAPASCSTSSSGRETARRTVATRRTGALRIAPAIA